MLNELRVKKLVNESTGHQADSLFSNAELALLENSNIVRSMIAKVIFANRRFNKPVVIDGKKYIQLQQDQTIYAMAGYQYAKQLWSTYVEPQLTETDKKNGFFVLLPTHVTMINDSFIDSMLGCALADETIKANFGKFSLITNDPHEQDVIDEMYNDIYSYLNQSEELENA